MFRYLLTLAVVLSPAFLFAEDSKEELIKKDRALIAGKWRAVKIVVNGDEVKKDQAQSIVVVNGSDNTWSLRDGDNEVNKGTNEFDPTKMPKWIDVTITGEDGKGAKHLGIYELGEKTRRLCLAPPGKDRPKEFKSEAGSEVILVEFERVK